MDSDTKPTINAVWKSYTLFVHPWTGLVCVQPRALGSKIYSVSKAAAEKMLQREGLDIAGNQLYTEILQLYKEEEARKALPQVNVKKYL